MKYFKNTELAKIYNVSEKSVRNWVQAARDNKLELQLHDENGKYLVANTAKNVSVIESLVAKGKKFKNTRGYKVVVPKPKFYKLYNQKQIIDIISNLDIYRETPLQYSYFNSGAVRWNRYTQNLLNQHEPNSLTNTIQLLDLSMNYLDKILKDCKYVNVIDIGSGNALPIRGVLDHFLKTGQLKRYIGVDISQELLGIAEENIKKWYGGKVKFEGYVRDIVYDRFDDLVINESFGESSDSTVNLIFFLGGTLSNFREPNRVLSTIHDSMGKKDLIFMSRKMDTEKTRRYFEIANRENHEIDLVLNLLNIDESLYTLEQYFDEENMARVVKAKLNVALAIKFQLKDKERVLEFNKGESILICRAVHHKVLDTLEQFDTNGFDVLQGAKSPDAEYLLLISRIKSRS